MNKDSIFWEKMRRDKEGGRMNIYKNLYVGDSLKGKEKTVLRNIKRKRPQLQAYVIVLSRKEGEQLEIYHTAMLLQPLYFREDPWIIGIAANEPEAYALVEEIAGEVYEATKTFEIKKYIQERI